MIPNGANHFPSILQMVLPKGGSVVMMWHGFFDESGCDQGSRFLVVGGYVVEHDKSLIMDEKWGKALKEYGVETFHMVDCAHRAGEFKKLSRGDCINLEKRLINLVHRYCEFGVLCFSCVDEFKDDLGYDRAYQFLSGICMEQAVNRIRLIDDTASISVFFESGHANQGAAYDRIKSRNYAKDIPVTFASKKTVRLLQAGDLLAWQARKNISDIAFQQRKTRKDYIELCEGGKVPHMMVYLQIHNAEVERSLTFHLLDKPSDIPSDHKDNIIGMIDKSAKTEKTAGEHLANWTATGERFRFHHPDLKDD